MLRNHSQVFLLFLLALCLGGTTARCAEPLRIRVLSYNIHHGRGADEKVDMERIAAVIRSVEPDLVALQEVDSGVMRSGRINEPEELARLTKLTPVFGNNIKYEGGDYGNAILTRWPVKSFTNHKLKSFYNGEQRGLMDVTIELPKSAGELRFFATHIDYRANSPERLPSAVTINEILAQRPDVPAILAGDLNEPPEASAVQELLKHWTRTNDGELPTYPADKPKRQIDHILVAPPGRWTRVETKVLEDAMASDHRGIVSEMKLETNSSN